MVGAVNDGKRLSFSVGHRGFSFADVFDFVTRREPCCEIRGAGFGKTRAKRINQRRPGDDRKIMADPPQVPAQSAKRVIHYLTNADRHSSKQPSDTSPHAHRQTPVNSDSEETLQP